MSICAGEDESGPGGISGGQLMDGSAPVSRAVGECQQNQPAACSKCSAENIFLDTQHLLFFLFDKQNKKKKKAALLQPIKEHESIQISK